MKKTILLFLSFIILVEGQKSQAQNIFQNREVKVEFHDLKVKGDNLFIKLTLNKSSLVLAKNKSLTLTPYLQDSLGNKAVLPEIWINGNNRQRVYQRSIALNSGLDKYRNAKVVLKASDRSRDKFDYNSQLKYETWMKNASLYIQEDECGCNSLKILNRVIELQKIKQTPPYIVRPCVSFIIPPKEEIKKRNESFDTYLDFAVGSYTIKPDFRRNPAELNRLTEVINKIGNDNTISFYSIELIGKTSPEGTFNSNEKLAYNRANALKNYLELQHNIAKTLYKSYAQGEDWIGFRKLIEESNYTQKEELLAIINNDKTLDIKEKEIKQVNNGLLYKQLNEEIFPQLRRVTCEINYTVCEFDIEKSKSVIKTNPERLSLEEFHSLANSYPIGSKEFDEVFEVAATLFPNDQIANNNAAAAAILTGNYQKAMNYLSKLSPSAEYFNNMGVMEFLKGNYKKSFEYLYKAKENGSKEALNNLQELEKKQIENQD